MTEQPDAPVRFTLKGARYELSRSVVETRLAGVVPESIYRHAVRVNDTWYPMQAFEIVLGFPRSRFISHEARRHLAAFGFEVRGQVAARSSNVGRVCEPRPAARTLTDAAHEWYREVAVQATVVASLLADGWRIVSVADTATATATATVTATKERGVDIVAARGSVTVGIEVKGFPTRGYADPARAAETNRPAPVRKQATGSARRSSPPCGCVAESLAGEA